MRWAGTAAAAALGIGAAAATAGADIVFATEDPFESVFGLIGYPIGGEGPREHQVGIRFTPDADYRLDRISVWFMSDDFFGISRAPVRITVQTDDPSGGETIPSGVVLEELGFEVSTVGWNPVLEVMDSAQRTLLRAGEHYWIVADSDVVSQTGVWNWPYPFQGDGFTAI